MWFFVSSFLLIFFFLSVWCVAEDYGTVLGPHPHRAFDELAFG